MERHANGREHQENDKRLVLIIGDALHASDGYARCVAKVEHDVRTKVVHAESGVGRCVLIVSKHTERHAKRGTERGTDAAFEIIAALQFQFAGPRVRRLCRVRRDTLCDSGPVIWTAGIVNAEWVFV